VAVWVLLPFKILNKRNNAPLRAGFQVPRQQLRLGIVGLALAQLLGQRSQALRSVRFQTGCRHRPAAPSVTSGVSRSRDPAREEGRVVYSVSMGTEEGC
jgi:hypothetical protein